MTFPRPWARSGGYLPPGLAPDQAAAMQQMADHAAAAERMRQGLAAALAFADAHADHRAPRLTDDVTGDRYVLDRFLDFALSEAADFAADRLGSGIRLAAVIPMWVHTVIDAPRTGPDYATIPALGPDRDEWTLTVLAAAGRAPSLLTLSWDWCGVYPCIGPDAWHRQHTNARFEPVDAAGNPTGPPAAGYVHYNGRIA